MDLAIRALTVMPTLDWVALGVFILAWWGYVRSARHPSAAVATVLAASNRARRRWLEQTTLRDNRMLDAVVVQNLSSAPGFFASTTILIIGGLMAALSADKAVEIVREMPFAARTSALVFDIKLAVLLAIFIHAFFRFTWAVRQYSFGAILVGGTPPPSAFGDEAYRLRYAEKASRVVELAAESFNDGLRAYYFAFAVSAWFISPWAMLAANAIVIYVLYVREFRSQVLEALDAPEISGRAPPRGGDA